MLTIKEVKRMQKDAKKGSIMKKKLENGTFFNKDNKVYINDMFDDTKISTGKCPKQEPRIGRKYQVVGLRLCLKNTIKL